MQNRLCDRFGIEFPLFAFSHCRDVVVAVSRAGGFGVIETSSGETEACKREIAAMRDRYDPALPSCRAIGVPELIACHDGTLTLAEARERAIISTRQFAKRQRTWFRSKMAAWQPRSPA